MGHVAALRLRGYEVPTPIFLPGVGAVMFSSPVERRDDEAFIAIGGPLLGSFAAVLVFVGWALIEDKQETLAQNLLFVSALGVSINLFNLIPISPFDGGRITQAVGSWVVYPGIAVLVWLTIAVAPPMAWLLWLLLLPRATVFSKNVRFVLALLLWGTMTTQLLLDLSMQTWFISLVYCLVGILLVFVAKHPNANKQHLAYLARPQLPLVQRCLWFCHYLLLVAVLVAVLMVQIPILLKPLAQ